MPIYDGREKAIVVTLQVPGIHRWAECPLDEVAYLRDFHRHVFHFRVVKYVTHNEREVEIILFKQKVFQYLNERFNLQADGSLNFENWSCERLAEAVLDVFDCIEVQVLEDGENGAIVTKKPSDDGPC